MSPRDLPSHWRSKAEELRELKAAAQAKTLEWCADQLQRARREWELEELTLERAAEESGYTPEHLGRLVRESKLPNAGGPYAPRIVRRDLPRKPGYQTGHVLDSDDPVRSRKEQIARSVVNSETQGERDG